MFKPDKVGDAFLGAIDTGGSPGAEQRVVDVAGHEDLGGPRPEGWGDLVSFQEGF